ncbi:MAG: TPM domain-containing protein [Ignavibacteria bacterium]|nr:TPM domain-containing protein [Ignavibacteria bacterium]
MLFKVFLILLFSVNVFSQPKVPTLTKWATDFTNTLTPNELNQLNNYLKTFEDSTSNQLLFLMIPTLEGFPIEDFAYETAKQNKIGSKKNDNGILFLVAKDDRLLRIEVGYGLEGALPDAVSSQIIRNEVVPQFKNGNFFAGIAAGIQSIVDATAGEYKSVKKKDDKFDSFGDYIPLIFFLISAVSFFGRKGRKSGIYFGGFPVGGFGGGRSSGSGGFGGFSGGGGSFGGGGSSGSW